MAAHSTFAGLRALAAKVGAMATPAPSTEDDDDTTGQPGEDGAGEGEDPANPANTPAEGEDGGEGAGEGEDGAGEGEDGEEGEDEGEGAGTTTATTNTPNRSADYLAGVKAGREQEAGRFAAVLISPVARANLEMATDLLATSTMTPSAIIGMCDRYKGEGAAQRLLDATPKPKIGASGGGTSEPDDAKDARAAATAKVNARVGGGRRGMNAAQPVRKSRRAEQKAPAAAAGKE